jgi:hypothetical protein
VPALLVLKGIYIMKMKKLYADESTWRKGFFAADKEGKSCMPEDKKAVSWCLIGAIYKCYDDKKARKVFDKVVAALPVHISVWNDDQKRTFQDVKDLVTLLDI